MTSFKSGDIVYQKAADRVFDALANHWTNQPRRGPLTVDKVYRCGQHWRLSAHGSGLTKIDAAVSAFEAD